jgi:hypothetical protein
MGLDDEDEEKEKKIRKENRMENGEVFVKILVCDFDIFLCQK